MTPHVSSIIVLIIRMLKFYYTAPGIITPVGGRPCTYQIQFWPPDDEHIVFETCRGIQWIYYKTRICSLSWLISKIIQACREQGRSNNDMQTIWGSRRNLIRLALDCIPIALMTRPFINPCSIMFSRLTQYTVLCAAGCEMFKVIHHRFGLIRALGYCVRQLSDVRFVFYTDLMSDNKNNWYFLYRGAQPFWQRPLQMLWTGSLAARTKITKKLYI